MSDYELEIISREKQAKKLKKYKVSGNDVVGVYENEPFSVRFKNNTSKRVQVRLSIDGTDVLTGNPASTDPEGKMWMVNSYSDMELRAWPETTQGGAEFLFGKTGDSVAANTHGIMDGKGIIAAAVYEEDSSIQGYTWNSNKPVITGGITIKSDGGITIRSAGFKGLDSFRISDVGESYSYNCSSYTPDNYNTVLDSGPAVGAGSYVDQEINKVAGLCAPHLSQIIQVKYEWWTSLKSKLRKHPTPHHVAFPGDNQKLMSLGSTPRRRRQRRRGRHGSPERKYKEFNRFI